MEPVVQRKTRITQLNEILADSQKRSYFVVAVTVLFFILFLVLGVIPAYGDVISQISENNTINDAIEDATQKKTDLKSLLDQNTNDATLITYFDEKILPDGNSQDDIIEEIYGEAENLDMVISNFVFSENVNSAEIQALWFLNGFVQSGEFRVEATGSLDSVLEFISFFDESKRVYHTQNISLFGDTSASLIDNQELEEEEIELGNDVMLGTVESFKISMTLRYFYWDTTILEGV